MNTRLQVEHPVTEAVTGIDLVEWQLRIARGEPFTRQAVGAAVLRPRHRGAALRRRPVARFPAAGGHGSRCGGPAEGVRTDHALETGAEVSAHYDSMIAKVIAHGPTRDAARAQLAQALDRTVVLGLPTNKAFLAAVLRDEEFAKRGATTDFLAPLFVR